VLLKGDGSVYVTSRIAVRAGKTIRLSIPRIELKNKSQGFLTRFNEECAIVLGRRMVTVSSPNHEGHRMVRYVAKDFVSWWLTQTLEKLMSLIEAFPIEYLRGRFDSDSNVQKNRIDLIGVESQRRLMEYERILCRKLGMRVGRIRSHGKVGEETFVGAKRIVSKQPKIRFSVNTGDFAKTVGTLNVEWKNEALTHSTRTRRWTPWSGRFRERAKELEASGLNCRKITDQLSREFQIDVPYDTVYSWLRRGVKAWDEYYTAPN
jgi:intein-encoded DNA endonuclease-like protein